jgi:hypothetical protein
MSDYPKYVIVGVLGWEIPILFDSLVSHKDVVGNMNVVSAGFYVMSKEKNITVFGKSDTLRVDSRKEDKKIIEDFLKQDDDS